MKDNKKQKLKEIASRIAEMEKLCQQKGNFPKCMAEMNNLISGLDLEELLFIDEYILKEKLLTK